MITLYHKEESWLILSSIERSIKTKIEKVGVPLRDWDVRINRGILTGYNKAFIIDNKVKDELIAQDPRSADIIRPILRGKDIKRYKYHFSEMYLITTYNEYIDSSGVKHPTVDVSQYPAIKKYLDSYWSELSKRQDKGDTPYNLRRCAYMDDFNKQKIVFSRISGNEPCFALDNDGCMVNDTAYIIVGNNIEYLLDKLCSPLYWFAFRKFYMGGGIDREFKVNNLQNLPIPLPGTAPIELTREEKNCIASFETNNL